MKKYVLGITAASGAPIALRVLETLLKSAEVHLIATSGSFYIIRHETGLDFAGKNSAETEAKFRRHFKAKRLYVWDEADMAAPVSSGSFITDGMLIVPCSMKTLAGVAAGYANTLVERSADVTIKEGRTLVVCPRETPFSGIHLENMLRLSRVGVRIVPPICGYYHGPKSLSDMTDFIAGKILASMGVKHSLFPAWKGDPEKGEQKRGTRK